MDADKDLIRRAVGNSAERSMSSSAQKRTIDWVDPHSAASTPRKLQSPRGGRSEVQDEETKRVEEEQAREEADTVSRAIPDSSSLKDGSAEPETGVEDKDGDNKINDTDSTETKDTENVKEQKEDIRSNGKEATEPEISNGHTATEKETSKESSQTESHSSQTSKKSSQTESLSSQPKETAKDQNHSRSTSKTPSRASSTPTRSETPQPLPTYNTWKYPVKTITKASPSAKEGMPFREELTMRTKGINFLGNVAKLLQLPHMAVYTACTFFHRFYMRNSIKSKHPFEAAAVCIFLATKVEEANRHLRDVCICLVKVAQKDHRAVVDEQSKDFWRWRDCILYGEGFFLEVLCFDLTLDSPFEHLSYYVKKLGINHVREVCKTAWEFVTDSCKTPLCLMFSTNTIALAAIYWAAKHNKTPIDYAKETKAKGKQHWVECFDMTRNEVVYVVETFCDWYGVLQRDFGLAASYPKLK